MRDGSSERERERIWGESGPEDASYHERRPGQGRAFGRLGWRHHVPPKGMGLCSAYEVQQVAGVGPPTSLTNIEV